MFNLLENYLILFGAIGAGGGGGGTGASKLVSKSESKFNFSLSNCELRRSKNLIRSCNRSFSELVRLQS